MAKKYFGVGINSYRDPYRLPNSLNDLADFVATMQAKGFSGETRTDGQATKGNIILRLRALVDNAVTGDKIAFGFFGHGSWTPGPEPDGHTECLCCYDWEAGGLLMDYEIASILAPLAGRGVSCTMIMSCCFAGGDTTTRTMDEPWTNHGRTMEVYDKKNKGKKKKYTCMCIPGPQPTPLIAIPRAVVPVPGANHVACYACGSLELAYWGTVSGKKRGIFTPFLFWALRNMPTATWAQIDAYVAAKVTALVPTQHPYTEGTPEELASVPFA